MKVRFASTNVVADEQSIYDHSLTAKETIWWSSHVLRQSHQEARNLCLEARQKSWMVKGFEDAFDSAQKAAASETDDESIQQLLNTTFASTEVLDWCRYGHSWRGLERPSSTKNDKSRCDVQRLARKAVLENSESDPNLIRSLYQRASLPAKVFARVMGEADALAVAQGRERLLLKRRRSTAYEDAAAKPQKNTIDLKPTLLSLQADLCGYEGSRP